jgi:hypothetical protein
MFNLLARLIPFLLLGMALVALAFGIMLFAYLLFFGAIVGLGLFAFNWVKERFFPSKQIVKRSPPPRSGEGRTIDHE